MASELVIYTTLIDNKLLSVGLKGLNLYELNELIMQVANTKNMDIDLVTDEVLFEYQRELKIDLLSERCQQDILKGFTSKNGNHYRTNRDDQINIIGQKDYLQDNPDVQQVFWKTENKGYVRHTRDEWFAVYYESFIHKQRTLFKYDTLKKIVLALSTDTDINDINWDDYDENGVLIPAPTPKPPEINPPIEKTPIYVPEIPETPDTSGKDDSGEPVEDISTQTNHVPNIE